MEEQLENLAVFESYKNRQVILNYYDAEDFLWKRDGFQFISLQLINGELSFIKKDGNNVTIPLKSYETVAKNSDFQNYYIFRNGEERLEIYFP